MTDSIQDVDDIEVPMMPTLRVGKRLPIGMSVGAATASNAVAGCSGAPSSHDAAQLPAQRAARAVKMSASECGEEGFAGDATKRTLLGQGHEMQVSGPISGHHKIDKEESMLRDVQPEQADTASAPTAVMRDETGHLASTGSIDIEVRTWSSAADRHMTACIQEWINVAASPRNLNSG